jgi:hypothetical protein
VGSERARNHPRRAQASPPRTPAPNVHLIPAAATTDRHVGRAFDPAAGDANERFSGAFLRYAADWVRAERHSWIPAPRTGFGSRVREVLVHPGGRRSLLAYSRA